MTSTYDILQWIHPCRRRCLSRKKKLDSWFPRSHHRFSFPGPTVPTRPGPGTEPVHGQSYPVQNMGYNIPSQYPDSFSVDYFYTEHIPTQPLSTVYHTGVMQVLEQVSQSRCHDSLKPIQWLFIKIQKPVEKMCSRNFNYSVGIIHPGRPCIYGDNTKD